jgi:2-succinyl-5-enolpyruvyl-6-hydroxy-3-cyclohexene-1-carboxylate synthase
MQKHVHSIALTCHFLGVKHIIISPGSRSAPLVFAFAVQRKFDIHTVVDERSAAYQALGIAQQTQKPVVLICTSGTAAANYYPALAEAYYQGIPLLVLTADRPEPMLNQQDGQMINQQQLFGVHVKGFHQLPCYPHGAENHKETTAITAKAIAMCMGAVKGPVHINVPLAEPLYPKGLGVDKELEKKVSAWLSKHMVNTTAHKADSAQMLDITHAWVNSTKRIILIGQGVMHEKWITSLLALKQQNDVIILADIASNKMHCSNIPNFDKLISAANPKLLAELKPELLISVGGAVLSKSLKNWLKQQQPKWHFRVDEKEALINTYQNVTHHLKADVSSVLYHLAHIVWSKPAVNTYVNNWLSASTQLQQKVNVFANTNTWSELHATAKILTQLPIGANLQLANSSVVRYASWLANINPDLIVNSNRGTSGIDGCTSTAVGAAQVNLRPTVLLTGDVAFLYDKNALWQQHMPANLRIIVFNNGGGGIFTLIDGPTRIKAMEQYFTTPHKQSIKAVAVDNGLDYYFCASADKLNQVLQDFLNPLHQASVLELSFDMKRNAKIFEQFKKIKL